MPRAGKRIRSDSSRSESEEEEHSLDSFLDSEDDFVTELKADRKKTNKAVASARAKKAAKKKTQKEKWLPLGNDRRVTVSTFKKTTYVSIRQYYMNGDGEYVPTKKGISLTKAQWKALVKATEKVNKWVTCV